MGFGEGPGRPPSPVITLLFYSRPNVRYGKRSGHPLDLTKVTGEIQPAAEAIPLVAAGSIILDYATQHPGRKSSVLGGLNGPLLPTGKGGGRSPPTFRVPFRPPR